MIESTTAPAFSRRRLALLASGIAAAGAAPALAQSGNSAGLPIAQMNKILGAKGEQDEQVVDYGFTRTDLHGSLPGGIKVEPSAFLQGDVYFQATGGGAIVNADLCLAQHETAGFIDALLSNGLTVQAFHQHLVDISPMVWFIHFRGQGEPLKLAQAVANAIKATSTPLPQPSAPPDNVTPFDKKMLKQVLGGDVDVHDNGVAEVNVRRAERFTLKGQPISAGLNIATNIYFQPLDAAGKQALAIPDFGMLAKEIDGVLRRMSSNGWSVGCLYNQETAENPQLFWSHMWKIGAPETLAQEIKGGLDLCDMKYQTA